MPAFRVLGPLEVDADDGTTIALGGARQRAVLAVLLLRAGEVVSKESLITSIWGESPPKAAVTALQNSIVALRRALGPDLLRWKPPGYVLEVNGGSLDLRQFEQLRREAAGREPPDRARLLREALDLWRGRRSPSSRTSPSATTSAISRSSACSRERSGSTRSSNPGGTRSSSPSSSRSSRSTGAVSGSSSS